MGLGDIDLLAMIRTFMGWQRRPHVLPGAVLRFGAGWKLLRMVKKWLIAANYPSPTTKSLWTLPQHGGGDLLLLWPRFWRGWAKRVFDTLFVIFWWMFGVSWTFLRPVTTRRLRHRRRAIDRPPSVAAATDRRRAQR
jgi:hypothetical protein